MYKYSLALKTREKGKVKYNPFNIGTYSLEEIDKFTTSFNDNDSLSEALVKEGIISHKEYGKYIALIQLRKEDNKLIMYGPLYKEAKNLTNPEILKKSILELVYKSSRGDKESLDILNKYAGRFYRIPPTEGYVGSIYEYVRLKNYNKDVPELLQNKLIRDIVTIFNIYVYDYNARESAYILDDNGNRKVKYKPLHDLAAWFNNQVKPKKVKEEKLEKEEIKPLIKVDDNQISIFDYFKGE